MNELREQIVPALRKIHQALPTATVMLCEVIRHSPETLHDRPGGLSEIQFFHELSNQRLFTREEWQEMFKEAGVETILIPDELNGPKIKFNGEIWRP